MRQLSVRIKEHNQRPRKSEIFSHISQCDLYQNELKKLCPDMRKTTGTFFLKTRFKILASNLQHYNERTIFESLYIHLLRPNLNIQNSFRSLSLL